MRKSSAPFYLGENKQSLYLLHFQIMNADTPSDLHG